MGLNQSAGAIAGVEFNSARLVGKGENAQSFEQSAKVGLGGELSDELYGQITAGKRFSQIDGRNESSWILMRPGLASGFGYSVFVDVQPIHPSIATSK